MSNPTVVVVTGVSSGIGRAAAEKFAKRGCRVFGTVRSAARTAPVALRADHRYSTATALISTI